VCQVSVCSYGRTIHYEQTVKLSLKCHVVAGPCLAASPVASAYTALATEVRAPGVADRPGVTEARPAAVSRGLHSSTFQLKLSALYGIGGARRGCVARVKGELGGVRGCFGCVGCFLSSDTAQVELSSGRV